MHTIKRSWWLPFMIIGALSIGAAWWFYQAKESQGVVAYEPSRDRAFVLDLFKKDWYWLISDYSPDYSPEHMLDYKSPSKESKYQGQLILKTYVEKGHPVGFTAYYMKEFLEGYILFLAVGKEYRGHGYARKLLSYALEDLKKRGAAIIRLITRTDNERGRKLYTGMGFKETWTDGAYVKYEKVV